MNTTLVIEKDVKCITPIIHSELSIVIGITIEYIDGRKEDKIDIEGIPYGNILIVDHPEYCLNDSGDLIRKCFKIFEQYIQDGTVPEYIEGYSINGEKMYVNLFSPNNEKLEYDTDIIYIHDDKYKWALSRYIQFEKSIGETSFKLYDKNQQFIEIVKEGFPEISSWKYEWRYSRFMKNFDKRVKVYSPTINELHTLLFGEYIEGDLNQNIIKLISDYHSSVIRYSGEYVQEKVRVYAQLLQYIYSLSDGDERIDYIEKHNIDFNWGFNRFPLTTNTLHLELMEEELLEYITILRTDEFDFSLCSSFREMLELVRDRYNQESPEYEEEEEYDDYDDSFYEPSYYQTSKSHLFDPESTDRLLCFDNEEEQDNQVEKQDCQKCSQTRLDGESCFHCFSWQFELKKE